jgi:hypothetical protein
MAKTLQEAQIRQIALGELIEGGHLNNKYLYWRAFSLSDDYEIKECPSEGIGVFPVHKVTRKVCQHSMQWDTDGIILLCSKCFIDGT